MKIEPDQIKEIERLLCYTFTDKNLLIRALTRKAYAQEQRQRGLICEDQEMYCTWGDAILKLILVELLSLRGYTNPATITTKKSELERRQRLGTMFPAMALAPFISLGRGERKQQVEKQTSVIAETFEAVIAAIYQDGGYKTIKKLVTKWFRESI